MKISQKKIDEIKKLMGEKITNAMVGSFEFNLNYLAPKIKYSQLEFDALFIAYCAGVADILDSNSMFSKKFLDSHESSK